MRQSVGGFAKRGGSGRGGERPARAQRLRRFWPGVQRGARSMPGECDV